MVLAPALPSYPVLIAGLRRVTAVKVRAASVAFSQHAAAAGRLRWSLELSFYMTTKSAKKRSTVMADRPVGKPIRLATGSRTVTKAGTVRARLKLGPIARKRLERHPAARLVLRTTLTLGNQRVIRATETLSRPG